MKVQNSKTSLFLDTNFNDQDLCNYVISDSRPLLKKERSSSLSGAYINNMYKDT